MIKVACVLTLAAALLVSAEPPVPVPAPVTPTKMLNSRLPRRVQFNGEARYREGGFLGNLFTEGDNNMYLLQRFRPGMRLQPASPLGFFVQGQDSRAYATDRTFAAPSLHDRARLRVGRQEFASGEVQKGHTEYISHSWALHEILDGSSNYMLICYGRLT
jgi:hypothetical protein